jgi:transcriptional regulator with XRE-family HTH domain
MDNNYLLTPKAIRSARTRRGWTQSDFAEKIGVSQSTISFWERGLESPSLENQIKLVTLMPELVGGLTDEGIEFLQELLKLERVVYGGKCSCENCQCE